MKMKSKLHHYGFALFLLVVGSIQSFAQTTCSSSSSLTPNPGCTLTDYSFGPSDTVQWFSFTADSQRVFIDVEQPVSSSPAAHVHDLELFDGSCASLNSLASRNTDTGDTVFTQSAILKLDYAGLVIGQTYFIRVARRTPGYCSPSICQSNVAYFSMCVQNMSTVTPCSWPGPYDCGEKIGNGGFEYIDPTWNGGCPFDITQGGDPIVACPWEGMPLPSFVTSTPDFFNICANPSDVGIPSNGFCYQNAFSGNGYAGIVGVVQAGPPFANQFEGLMQTFSSPLIAGKVYYEEMHVSLANMSTLGSTIGFTSFPVGGTNDYYHPTNITDTANWTKVSHCFTADGSEVNRAITWNGSSLPPIPVVGSAGCTFSNPPFPTSYFYIDDVSLRPLAFAGSSVTTCSFATLGCTNLPPIAGATYSWSVAGPGSVTFTSQNAQSTGVTLTTQGTYTFTITATLGSCVDTDTVTVTMIGFTSVFNASATAVCAGDSVSLSVTNTPASGTFSYSWSPASGLSSTTINNPNAAPNASTTYTVVVTNLSTGCTSTATITIGVSSPSVTIVGPPTDNTCGTSVYTANVTSGISPFTYLWSTSANGIISGSNTVNPITVNWNGSGTGTVIVSITDSTGCTATDTISVSACCVPDTGMIISNDTASVLFGPNPPFMFFQNWNINGTFIVDVDMIVAASLIKMGPNARILVTGGSKLVLDKDTIRAGCCEMWDAIEGQSLGDTIEVNGCYMGDGIRGITSNNGSVYKVFGGCIFNRNRVSITVNPYAGVHGGTVEQTTFESVDMSYCPSINGAMLPPFAGIFPVSGIYVNKVDSIVIGNPAQLSVQNTFIGLQNGIRTRLTTSGIYNSSFVSINRAGSNSKAIYATGSFSPLISHKRISVGGVGLGGAEKNYFTDCPFGVYTDTAISVRILHNKFQFTFIGTLSNLNGTAIAVNRNIGFADMFVTINNDTILNYGTGILCNENNFCNTVIQQNFIDRTLGGPTNNGTGISMFCTSSNGGINNIYINEIYGMRFGIITNSVNNVIINNNWVKVRTTGVAPIFAARGISVLNCSKPTVISNAVSRTVPGPPVTNTNIGCIYVSNSSGGIVNCNNVEQLAYGIQMTGPGTTSMHVFKNSMKNHVYGMWFSNGAIPGPQGNPNLAQDNRWQGSFTNRCWTSGSTLGHLSFFYYRSPGNTFNPNPSFSAPGSTPISSFVTNPNPPQTFCTYVVPPGQNHGLRLQVAQGQVPYTSNQAMSTFLSKEGLYGSILLDSTLINGDSILIAFRDSVDHSNLGIIVAAQNLYSERSSNIVAVANALNDINGVTPVLNAEGHDQTIAAILLNHQLNGGQFTVAELDTLRSIAILCPFTDGNSVYVARGLLVPYDNIFYESPCETSAPNSNRMASEPVDSTSSDVIRVYPNPSDGNLAIEYQLNEGEIGVFEIYSATGAIVESVQLNDQNGLNTVNLNNLDAGMYTYKFIVDGELKEVDRLIIIK